MSQREQGTIKFFGGRIGTITPDSEGKEVAFHESEIRIEGMRSLSEGSRVEYSVEKGPRGPMAVDVRPV